tara:strand:- start:135 stop:689 length:555 start_codon:yes stop_codon:yes gene_type:complete
MNSNINSSTESREFTDRYYLKKYYNSIYEKYIHIVFIIIFEILFYFKYISRIESDDIIHILNTFGNYLSRIGIPWTDIIDSSDKAILSSFCNGITNTMIDKNNISLENKCMGLIYILLFIWVVMTIFHYSIYKSYKLIIINIIKSQLFICIIGVFEFYFFTRIVNHYSTISNEEATCILLNDII